MAESLANIKMLQCGSTFELTATLVDRSQPLILKGCGWVIGDPTFKIRLRPV